MASVLVWIVALSLAAKPAGKAKPGFEYDPADEAVHATRVGNEHTYEPHVVALKDRLWITWLEFEPGKGDRIWVGCRDAEGTMTSWTPIGNEPGIFRNPTLTPDKAGGLWLSYEQQLKPDTVFGGLWLKHEPQGNEQWFVTVTPLSPTEETKQFLNHPLPDGKTTSHSVPGINHRTATDYTDGIWIIWQDEDFGIRASHATPSANNQEPIAKFPNGHAWHPDIAVLPNGEVVATFDACEGGKTGFDTYVVRRNEGKGQSGWSAPRILSATDAFEARTRVVSDANGRVWTAWEEGNRNWGKPYRSMMRKLTPDYLAMTDDNGPLHAFRRLHINELVGNGRSPIDPPLPMPAMDKLAHRPDAPKGVEHLGGYYENAELAVDGLGRLWVVYRHFYVPFQGVKKISHVQKDWGIYARCYDGKSWCKLFKCDIGQGDGMQRIEITALQDGIAMVYSTGRTDRRPSDSPINIALATIHLPGESVSTKPQGGTAELPIKQPSRAETASGITNGGYQLVFGDLHRHTDLSLCDVPTDGTMDDTYRFAIGAAKLDFLGITDHARDIDQGKESSLLWWRCRKEVSRHTLAPQFIGMYAYEHSRGGEDHNVISLRPDLLQSDNIPFPKLWAKMDSDTFTIPHQTLCKPIPKSGEMPLGLDEKTWSYGDDAHRPLMEIYQGCRDRAIDRDAHLGLSKGHIFGFIASSDHMSTATSFAGVWAEQRTRESIFRAMQARRTFGATAKICLRMMMSNKHWMGEQVKADEVGTVHVSAKGTAAIQSVDLIVDGRVNQDLKPNKQEIEVSFRLPKFEADQATSAGIHYFYVRVVQTDGNLAWSSPIWVKN